MFRLSCIFRVSFEYLSCIFRVSSGYLPCIFRVSFVYLSGIFRVCCMHVSCIFRIPLYSSRVSSVYLACIFHVAIVYLSCILRVSCLYLALILRVSFVYLWQSALSKAPSNEKEDGKDRVKAITISPTFEEIIYRPGTLFTGDTHRILISSTRDTFSE